MYQCELSFKTSLSMLKEISALTGSSHILPIFPPLLNPPTRTHTHIHRHTLMLILINGLHVDLPTGLEVGRRSGSETTIVCSVGSWKI